MGMGRIQGGDNNLVMADHVLVFPERYMYFLAQDRWIRATQPHERIRIFRNGLASLASLPGWLPL